MSDEFDKEAEREKLREKYSEDEEDRKATERMSDLLLKGATMTNTHCGTCGDPLFRQNGVTFCPSCHGGPEGVEGTGVEGAESQAGGGSPQQGRPQGRSQSPKDGGETTEIDVSTPGEAAESTGTEPADGPVGGSEPAPSRGDRAETGTPDRGRQPDRGDVGTPPSRGDSVPERSNTSEAPIANRAPPTGGSEATARDSLVEALERFSAEAAAADDPRYARECLEAAREAADALAALRR